MKTVDRYAVIGNPIEHSRSPWIHTEFARQTNQSLDYSRLLSPLDSFATTLQAWAAPKPDRLEAAAGGCNVTVPFKFEAFQLAHHHSERAQWAQAANTLGFDAQTDTWWADNTDGVGLVRAITEHAGFELAQRRILLLGAGGASAGVLGSLLQAGPEQIVVANRSADKAQALVQRHQPLASRYQVDLQAASLSACGRAYHLIINGTAASLQGTGLQLPSEVLQTGALAIDMMYGPAAQGFLQWAKEQGASSQDGLGMLVEQAAESFFLWRHIRPDTRAVLATLRRLLT